MPDDAAKTLDDEAELALAIAQVQIAASVRHEMASILDRATFYLLALQGEDLTPRARELATELETELEFVRTATEKLRTPSPRRPSTPVRFSDLQSGLEASFGPALQARGARLEFRAHRLDPLIPGEVVWSMQIVLSEALGVARPSTPKRQAVVVSVTSINTLVVDYPWEMPREFDLVPRVCGALEGAGIKCVLEESAKRRQLTLSFSEAYA